MEINPNKYKKYEINQDAIMRLKRCTKCLLPSTMPFIDFDDKGVCNYCRSYQKHVLKGDSLLHDWANEQKRHSAKDNCLISFSGGRDSSYSMHYAVKELGLKPVAFNYNWGMDTEEATANQKRMCDALNVKLVQVEANIDKKLRNIRKNVETWIKKPDIGMVPIFMAGDKLFFYHVNKIKNELHLDSILMADNPFEKTYFKSAYCGAKPSILRQETENGVEFLSKSGIFKMGMHYLRQFIKNPSYINSSIWDTAKAALSYYFIPHEYLRLFQYIEWNEHLIEDVLINEYGWKCNPHTKSTWRIGDGTSGFYNYIYYHVTGFTENDTLRSNQIREGQMTREEALSRCFQDNQPNFDMIEWYCNRIHVDFATVMTKIKSIKPMY